RHGARLPRRLPAESPPRDRILAARRRRSRRGLDQCARARRGHRASRRGDPRRLPRHHRVALAAGRPRRAPLWAVGRHSHRHERAHWASETYPADHISLRTVTTDNFVVIDTTARDAAYTKKRQIIAEVDWSSAFATIYPKAIYLVESVPYEVQELRFREDEEKV